MLQITHTDRCGRLRFRRYRHARLGVIETLTSGSVVYVLPWFDYATTAPTDSPSAGPVSPRKRRPRLGLMGKSKRHAGADA